MASVTAVWRRDAEHPTTLQQSDRGYNGVRWYLVNTDLEAAAMAADGLPKMGDTWDSSEELSGCIVTGIGPTYRMGGHDEGTLGEGGWTWVPVYYGPIQYGGSGGGGVRPRGHLDAWTEVRSSLESAPIMFSVQMDEDRRETVSTPIRNGEGSTVQIGVVEIIVRVMYNTQISLPNFALFNSLMRPALHVNREPFTTPYLYRTRARYEIPEYCGLYKGYTSSQNNQFLEIAHTIEIAQTPSEFFVRWEAVDSNGQPVSANSVRTARIYSSQSFSGLFGR